MVKNRANILVQIERRAVVDLWNGLKYVLWSNCMVWEKLNLTQIYVFNVLKMMLKERIGKSSFCQVNVIYFLIRDVQIGCQLFCKMNECQYTVDHVQGTR